MEKKKYFFLRVLNKIFNNLNLKYFFLSKLVAKYFFFTNYNSIKLNKYKIDAFKSNSHKLIETPSLEHLKATIDYYKKKFNSLPKTILDYGGGTGENAILISEIYDNKFSFDVVENDSLVRLANKNNFTHCKFMSDLEDKNYDIIFSSATLQYLDEPYDLLKKFEQKSNKLISLARLNCNEKQRAKLQVSIYRKNIGYKDFKHISNDNLAIYPYKELSLAKIKSSFKFFNFKMEKIKTDGFYYCILEK